VSTAVGQRRLKSVDAVRTHQRAWLERTREQVLAGEPFAICNADDFEEVFTALDMPVLVINYWNSIVTYSERKGDFYDRVLSERGYVPQRFAHGLATTLDPSQAPWGGLPRPTLIVGTTRDETQLRITELWAEAFDCECVALDFSWVSQFTRELPERWWDRVRDDCESFVDLDRVALRLEQIKSLIARLEQLTGRTFHLERFCEVMELLNQQMHYWALARDLVASARPLPVSLRDQMALYQVTWQRGTRANLELVQSYYEEVRQLITRGEGCYPRERFRVYLATSGNDPSYHQYLRDTWGGAIVSNRYSAVAPLYARTFSRQDPLRALALRHLFLFDKDPEWEVNEAIRWGADAMISEEPDREFPSRYKQVCEDAGIAHLGLPSDADTPETHTRIDQFVRARLERRLA